MKNRKLKLVQSSDGINALELDNPVHSEILIDYSEWEKHAGKPDNAIVDGVFVPGKDVEEPEQIDLSIAEVQNLTDLFPVLAWREILPKYGFYKEGD